MNDDLKGARREWRFGDEVSYLGIPVSPIAYGERPTGWGKYNDPIPPQQFPKDDGSRVVVYWNDHGPYRREVIGANGSVVEASGIIGGHRG